MCVGFWPCEFDRVRKAVNDLGYGQDIRAHGNAYFIRRNLLNILYGARLAHTFEQKHVRHLLRMR